MGELFVAPEVFDRVVDDMRSKRCPIPAAERARLEWLDEFAPDGAAGADEVD